MHANDRIARPDTWSAVDGPERFLPENDRTGVPQRFLRYFAAAARFLHIFPFLCENGDEYFTISH